VTTKHLKLFIQGIVQGVGFRPHVYNLAASYGLHGYVLNDSRGVTIELEGDERKLAAFRDSLFNYPPRLADIQSFSEELTENIAGYQELVIEKSKDGGEKAVLVSPDVSICGDCIREMNDPADPRHRYPFINCTNCGPRFTIIKDVPYDRHNTSMSLFALCTMCKGQYEDPSDRRFHAQPVACPVCGPRLFLLDRNKNEICKNQDEIIDKTADLLKKGKIIAIKGLGGYHLAVDAQNEEAVSMLRKRKYREDKPFAVMAPDIETIKKFCRVNEEEKKILTSFRSPIVLLERNVENKTLSPSVAPGNNYIGMMLPYTPLHYLLLASFGGILVMTSGNVSEEPICYRDNEAMERLREIADYFLIHNRPIHIRCDDTVTRVFAGYEYPIRRSRGYAPFPIILKNAVKVPILAVGAELKNTFCLYRNNWAFVSHHIGDLENAPTLASFEEGIEHYKKLFDIKPEIIAYDAHPRYLSTQYALKSNIKEKVKVQHHHAHVASVMADNSLDGKVIGVALDGVGYGDDGKLWGFEIMVAGYSSFKRVMHLKYIGLPGGEKAIKEPWRMAVAYLYQAFGDNLFSLPLPLFRQIEGKKIKFIINMIDKKISCPEISSAGRLFDAVSSITGLRHFCNFEAQAAILLEMIADKSETGFYDFDITKKNGLQVINPEKTLRQIVNDVIAGIRPSVISGKFHNTVAEMVLYGVGEVSKETGLKRAALSGGVFQNFLLLEKTKTRLEKAGFGVFIHRRVPTNDGGISLGQAVIAGNGLLGKINKEHIS